MSLLLIVASTLTLAQNPTTVSAASNCTFITDFDTDNKGFTSPSIYSDDNNTSFFWNSTVGAWIETSGLTERTASLISPVFINPLLGRTTVGFGYEVPAGTQYRVRVVSGATGTQQDIVATTANGPVWDPLPGTSGAICLFLLDVDIPSGSGVRYEVSFRAIAAGDMVFDNFAFASVTRTLPVTFLGFVAKQSPNGSIKLLWDVADEKDVVNYVAERSSNGVDFASIGSIPAIGSSTYSFEDADKLVETRYYRVKNVDVDGKSKYTPIIKVVPSKNTSGSIQLYPQPAHDQVYIQHEKAPATVKITIYTIDGKEVKSVMAIPNSYQTSLNISSLPAGTYIIKYDDGKGDIQTTKLIKN